MRQKSVVDETAEQHIKNIRRATRRQYSTEEKIRIVLSGLRGEFSIAERCRREGTAPNFEHTCTMLASVPFSTGLTPPAERSQ